MSGECSNCESRQRRGNDPRCLVCIYFNPAIFNKGFTNVKSQHFITKVEKAIEDAKVFRDKAKIADLRLKVKDVDEVLNSNDNSRTFQEIFDDKKEYWQNSDLMLQIYVDLKMHIKKFLKFMKVIKVISILHFHVLRNLEINMFAFMELIFRRELLLKRCILIQIIFNMIL